MYILNGCVCVSVVEQIDIVILIQIILNTNYSINTWI